MKPRLLYAAPLLLAVSSGCIIHISGEGWQGPHNLAYVHGDDGPFVRGNGIDTTERRDVPAFTAIKAATFFDVKVRVGAEQGVVLHGDENILPYVSTVVSGETLEVKMEPGTYKSESAIWIEIAVPVLHSYSLSGSGDTNIAGIQGEAFSLSLSGSGDVQAVGRIDKLQVGVSGSGDLDLTGLEAREAVVDVSGSADILVFVNETLSISISGSADVRYVGRPDITASITGSGSVMPR